jgi:hypothetical protein
MWKNGVFLNCVFRAGYGCSLLLARCLLGLLFYSEGGSRIFLRNTGELPPDYISQKTILFADDLYSFHAYSHEGAHTHIK